MMCPGKMEINTKGLRELSKQVQVIMDELYRLLYLLLFYYSK